jgi:hypothetical protein
MFSRSQSMSDARDAPASVREQIQRAHVAATVPPTTAKGKATSALEVAHVQTEAFTTGTVFAVPIPATPGSPAAAATMDGLAEGPFALFRFGSGAAAGIVWYVSGFDA